MSNFQTWYDNADMPQRDENGRWYDLEDGIAYDPNYNYSENKSRNYQQVNEKTLENRQLAKFLGGKALRGTLKQKQWAEKIRADVLRAVSVEAAELLCDPSGLCTHSKFWIENREKTAKDFQEYIFTQRKLIKEFNSLDPVNDITRRREIATVYNALTKEWNGAE